MRQPSREYLEANRDLVLSQMAKAGPTELGVCMLLLPMLIVGDGRSYYGWRMSVIDGETPPDAIFFQDAVDAGRAFDSFERMG